MKKWLLVLGVAVIFVAVLLSGCAKGVAPEEFATAQTQIKSLETQVADLSAISAYNIWYDQYYLYGTETQYYAFPDTASFNKRLGDLVYATGDSASKTAWDAYLVADTALSDVLAQLPEDYTTWTEEQTNQWSGVNTARYDALGAVGTALFNVITGY